MIGRTSQTVSVFVLLFQTLLASQLIFTAVSLRLFTAVLCGTTQRAGKTCLIIKFQDFNTEQSGWFTFPISLAKYGLTLSVINFQIIGTTFPEKHFLNKKLYVEKFNSLLVYIFFRSQLFISAMALSAAG